ISAANERKHHGEDDDANQCSFHEASSLLSSVFLFVVDKLAESDAPDSSIRKPDIDTVLMVDLCCICFNDASRQT
ncbi:MAG: hypothetical protein ABFD03_07975, partial [Clostridiaceae bacterium]